MEHRFLTTLTPGLTLIIASCQSQVSRQLTAQSWTGTFFWTYLVTRCIAQQQLHSSAHVPKLWSNMQKILQKTENAQSCSCTMYADIWTEQIHIVPRLRSATPYRHICLAFWHTYDWFSLKPLIFIPEGSFNIGPGKVAPVSNSYV